MDTTLDRFLDSVLRQRRADYAALEPIDQKANQLDLFLLCLYAPLAVISLAWLVVSTEWEAIVTNWLLLLLILAIEYPFRILSFRMWLELQPGVLSSSGGSLEALIIWSALLIFGPPALWVPVLIVIVLTAYRLYREGSPSLRLNAARNLVIQLATVPLAGLIGLALYRSLGGQIPLPGLTLAAIWPAALTLPIIFVLHLAIILGPLLFFVARTPVFTQGGQTGSRQLVLFLAGAMSLSGLAYPFAILAAGLYAEHGLGAYLYLVSGALLASLLANRLSRAVQHSQQRSRELAHLEALGRALVATPTERTMLPGLLHDHVRSMFPNCRVFIWLEPDEVLHHQPADVPLIDEAQRLARQRTAAFYRLQRVRLPDQRAGSISRDGLVVPIVGDDGRLLGGIYVLQRRDVGVVTDLLPAAQSLAALLASALRRAELQRQILASERLARELEVAGRIQASFLPHEIPQVPGWDIAATLVPARQTSGDFYDLILLGNGRLGLLIADVADKGTGAAIYMAFTRTLLRTFALQYPERPSLALQAANKRILADVRSDQFVTLFYGILDTAQGHLTYCNAGHNPPYHFGHNGHAAQPLPRTGIPLGILPEASWSEAQVRIGPGETLLLYTDGVTEAQDTGHQLFAESRLLATSQASLGQTAAGIQSAIIGAVQQFAGDAPQFDDITLLVLVRQ